MNLACRLLGHVDWHDHEAHLICGLDEVRVGRCRRCGTKRWDMLPQGVIKLGVDAEYFVVQWIRARLMDAMFKNFRDNLSMPEFLGLNRKEKP